jgi:sec-independent protein translocase protein TatB
VFDIGFGEFVLLAVVGLIVVGPDRLPQYAAQAARFLRQFRQQVDEARASVVEAVDIDPQTLKDLRDLDPRRALTDFDAELKAPSAGRTVRTVGGPLTNIEQVRLDPDTT